MAPFTHHLLAGHFDASVYGRPCPVYITIEYRHSKAERPELSICAVEGPKANGTCIGACGQVRDGLVDPAFTPAPGIDATRLREVWDRWHLNGMKAGSPAQEAHLRAHPIDRAADHFKVATEALRAAGLQPDPGHLYNGKPYSYGSAWLHEEVPEDVLQWLHDLPTVPEVPHWRRA